MSTDGRRSKWSLFEKWRFLLKYHETISWGQKLGFWIFTHFQSSAVTAEPDKQEEEPAAEPENEMDRLRESLIYEELLNMQASLRTRIAQERHEIERLTELLAERISTAKPKQPAVNDRIHSPSEAEITAMIQLVNENQLLEVNIFFVE